MRIAAFALSLALALPGLAEQITVSGKVLDADGKPVADASVGTLWVFGKNSFPVGYELTKADGSFTVKSNWNGRSSPILAMDAERQLGALQVFDDPAKPLELRLGPLTKVTVGLDRFANTLDGGAVNAQWIVRGKKPAFGSIRVTSSSFEIALPAGDYTVAIAHAELRYVEKDVTVPTGETFDAGTLATELTPIAAAYGKPAPAWFAADTRGLPKDVQPAALKGKWVLIEFWGTG